MCQKAMHPLARRPVGAARSRRCASTRTLVPIAKEALRGSPVKVASVATGFPSGQVPLSVKIDETAARSRPAPTRSTW